MPRKIMVKSANSDPNMLVESLAHLEVHLQEIVRDNPELLPVEEFGMDGPMMVIGREAPVSSGSIDLLGLSRGGDILVVEFKTGPQNPDFRHAMSQLIDYGSHIWGTTYEDFEAAAVKFFGSSENTSPVTKGKHSLAEAAHAFWAGLPVEEIEAIEDKVRAAISSGALNYVLAAQNITENMARTVEFLNHSMRAGRFFGVELVKFEGDGVVAFETRTIARPSKGPTEPHTTVTNEEKFLRQVGDPDLSNAYERMLAESKVLGLKIQWGSVGASIRAVHPESGSLVTLAWVFPPDTNGWMGFTDLTVGYDPVRVEAASGRSFDTALVDFIEDVGQLPNTTPESRGGMTAYRVERDAIPGHLAVILRGLRGVTARDG